MAQPWLMWRAIRIVPALCLALTLGSSCWASDPTLGWLPVTPAELEMKDVAGNPGAPAVQLYFAHYISEKDHSEFFYHRIKILNEAGKSYANVEIPVPSYRRVKIEDLAARTILPGGKLVDYTGQPFQTVILKGRGFKFLAESFTLPEVSVGSIIEYKYRLKGKEAWSIDREWLLEHELFTVREYFLFMFPPDWPANFFMSPGITKKPSRDKGSYELNLENVPAFEHEEQMPPEDQYRLRVRFFYSYSFSGPLSSVPIDWIWMAGPAYEALEDFVAPRREVRDAAIEAIGNETDPEQRLRKLYARAQQIRNLSYERFRTEQEEKKEDLKPNKNAADVIKHGYGDRTEINLLFVAFARLVGLDSQVILVSSRQHRLFDPQLPPIPQMDSRIILVRLDGRDLYLDPGTRFCPYGLVRWIYTATTAIRLRRLGSDRFPTPDPAPGDYFTARTSDLALGEDGSLTGQVVVEYRAGEALERRLDALDTDEAGRDRQLESEMKAWLPENAVIKLTGVEGWEAPSLPLTARFSIEVPKYAAAVGRRLLVPTSLFLAKRYPGLTSATRKYPVYFFYPFEELDRTTFTVPAGFTVESGPADHREAPVFAKYEANSRIVGQQLMVRRDFSVNRVMLAPTDYPAVKAFFAKVRANDDLQAVFQQKDEK
jgi:hypothetical protein